MLGAVQGILADLREEECGPGGLPTTTAGSSTSPTRCGWTGGEVVLRATETMRGLLAGPEGVADAADKSLWQKGLGGKAGYLQLPQHLVWIEEDAQHGARVRRRLLLARATTSAPSTLPSWRGCGATGPATSSFPVPPTAARRPARLGLAAPPGRRARDFGDLAARRRARPAAGRPAPRPRSTSSRRCCSAGWHGKPPPAALPAAGDPASVPNADQPGTDTADVPPAPAADQPATSTPPPTALPGPPCESCAPVTLPTPWPCPPHELGLSPHEPPRVQKRRGPSAQPRSTRSCSPNTRTQSARSGHASPYELAVATILSAQCTDARVNMVTPELFRRYPDPESLAAAVPAELEEVIRSTGVLPQQGRAT